MSDAHVTASKLTASGAIGGAGEERREKERESERAKKFIFDLLAVNKTVLYA